MADLSIIIVNYKSAGLLINCIDSILRFNPSMDAQLIVVDNDSGDNSRERVLEKFPWVDWIPVNYNAGFARANNEGIRKSKADVVLLLNPDILFEDDSLAKSYDRLSRSGHVGCGVQLKNPDGSPQITGSYFAKGGINHFLPLPVLGQMIKGLGTILNVKKPSVQEAVGEMEVDWINGAYLMVKKSAIAKAGLLDEDFFLYAEEIEWCSRLRRQGTFCVYGDLSAVHLQGETANETFGSSGRGYFNLSDRKGRQIMLSNFVRIRKQFGIAWFLIHLFVYALEIPFFFLKVLIQIILSKRNRWTAFTGFCKNLLVVLSYAFTIIRNKPHFYKVL